MARLDFIKLVGAFMTSYGLLRLVNGETTGLTAIIFGIVVMIASVIIERSEL